MDTPKIDLVVTRHPALLSLLIERGIASADTPTIEHAEAGDVNGLHVAGILPMWLVAHAASVTEIRINLEPRDRGRELTVDRLREIAGSTSTYFGASMARCDEVRPRWLAAAAAYRWVETHGQCFSAGPVQFERLRSSCRGLGVALIGDGSESCSAQLIESRGVWRPQGKGPWLDGYGREVDDEDIAPANGWRRE